MHEITGDLWKLSKQGHWIAIPTNGIVTEAGKLVMGRGLAYQLKIGNQGVERTLGLMVTTQGNVPVLLPQLRVATFPTKYHWRDPSTLELISESAVHIRELWTWGYDEVLYLPRVGCGNGGLKWHDVQPVLQRVFDDDPRFVVVTHHDDVSDTAHPNHGT